MLFRSNIFALVGGGQVPRWAPTKVIIWDEHQGRAIGELACKTPIKAVRMRRDRIAVALEQKVLLYDLDDLRVVHQTETAPNPEGLLALSTAADSTVLACPGLHAGEVRVDLLDTRRVKIIAAHDSPLAALALSPNGKLLATASERGTIIRVFSSADGTKLKEFRRGSDPAKIYCLAFSRGDTTEWLAATSDKGTAHVFSLQPGGGGASGSGSGALQSAGSGDSGITGSSPSRAAAGLAMLSVRGRWHLRPRFKFCSAFEVIFKKYSSSFYFDSFAFGVVPCRNTCLRAAARTFRRSVHGPSTACRTPISAWWRSAKSRTPCFWLL